MKRRWYLCIFVVCGIPQLVMATTYMGSLSVLGGTGDGLLTATAQWNNPATTLSWVVDNVTTPGKWHYEYTLSLPAKDISHMLIEVSDGDPGPAFTSANLFSPEPADWIATPIEIGVWGTQGNSNPGLPEPMHGIKFNRREGATGTFVTIRFDSDRVPVWGDFYAKSGGNPVPILYNSGFLAADPTVPPHNGSEQHHLLVPDSMTIVPAPGAILLGAIGVGLVGKFRRRGAL